MSVMMCVRVIIGSSPAGVCVCVRIFAQEGGDCLTLAGNEEGLKIEVDSSSDRAAGTHTESVIHEEVSNPGSFLPRLPKRHGCGYNTLRV